MNEGEAVYKQALEEVQKEIIAKTREREALDAKLSELNALARSLKNAIAITSSRVAESA
jgi:hypothetical protein